MRAGALDEPVVFKRLVEAQSASGAVTKVYRSYYPTRAARRKLSAVVGNGLNASEDFIGSTIVLQVRIHPCIKDDQRVEYMGNDYKINLIDKQGDGTYLLTCQKINK